MGNSKDRRRLRRISLEQLPIVPRPPRAKLLPKSSVSTPILKRIPSWVYGVIVISSILITLLEGYPWLSIQEGSLLDPSNPFSELFSVSNGGYAPVTDLSADCIIDTEDSNQNVFSGDHAIYSHFADYLPHAGNVTIPCFRSLTIQGVTLIRADLTVVIEYSFYPVTYRRFRKHQTFKLRAVKASDGSFRWTFLS